MTAQLIFDAISKVCPQAPATTNDVITIIYDERNIGKQFKAKADGTIAKESVVHISKAIACQFYVPDHFTLEKVLSIVSESPNAAITNCGWTPVALGTPFALTSRTKLKKEGLDVNGVHRDAHGVIRFARLKIHAYPSSWQVLDRDVDQFTPQWAQELDFNNWVRIMDKVLPGLASTRMLRAHSSSARVFDSKGKAVGGGNGHTWIKIADANEANRCRTAIIARAIEFEISWLKPKFSKKTGRQTSSTHTTIVDQSVWNMGRLLFVGKPTASAPLRVDAQSFTHVDGTNDVLDTSKAEISALNTYRMSKKLGVVVRINNSASGLAIESDNLRIDTELELEDGSTVTVQDAMKLLIMDDKLRCQAPFRESSSFAAFIALDSFGNPFVWDSGVDTKYVLPETKSKADADFNSLQGKLKTQLNAVIGQENTEAILDVDALKKAWDRSFANAVNNKIGLLNDKDGSIELVVTDAQSFGFRDAFGHFFNQLMLTEILDELTATLSRKDKEAFIKSVYNLETSRLTEMLKTRKQAKQLSVKVDMFAKRGSINTCDGIADITLPHRAFYVPDRPSASVIATVVADYYDHFPEFGPFLEMLLHARFSPDRRRAFVWLHANSDFGKGFMTSIFTELGLLFDITSAGIEKAISGDAVGLTQSAIFRCWILHVDEFKSASRELKQLNSSMQISAKFQLQTKVDLYVKLFSSAEGVRSLSGGGVETQFNMRFSYVHPKEASLDSRPVFCEIGKHQYLLAMMAHVADYLNAGVEKLVALGRVESSFIANAKVDEYQAARRLAATFGDIHSELREIAKRVRVLLRRYGEYTRKESENETAKRKEDIYYPQHIANLPQYLRNMIEGNIKCGYVKNENRIKYAIKLTSAASFIAAYLNQPGADKSTVGKFVHKTDEIARLAHCLNNKDGPTGNSGMYDNINANGTATRSKGLVVLLDADDHDLDDENAEDDELEFGQVGFNIQKMDPELAAFLS